MTAQIQQLLGTEGNAQGQGWPALNISADAVQAPCRIIQGQNLHSRKIRKLPRNIYGVCDRTQESIFSVAAFRKQFTDTSHERLV